MPKPSFDLPCLVLDHMKKAGNRGRAVFGLPWLMAAMRRVRWTTRQTDRLPVRRTLHRLAIRSPLVSPPLLGRLARCPQELRGLMHFDSRGRVLLADLVSFMNRACTASTEWISKRAGSECEVYCLPFFFPFVFFLPKILPRAQSLACLVALDPWSDGLPSPRTLTQRWCDSIIDRVESEVCLLIITGLQGATRRPCHRSLCRPGSCAPPSHAAQQLADHGGSKGIQHPTSKDQTNPSVTVRHYSSPPCDFQHIMSLSPLVVAS